MKNSQLGTATRRFGARRDYSLMQYEPITYFLRFAKSETRRSKPIYQRKQSGIFMTWKIKAGEWF
jgi:hypothetical protein